MGKSKTASAKGGSVKGKAGALADEEDIDAILNEAAQEAGIERRKAAACMKEADEWFAMQNYGQAVAKITEAIAADPNSGLNYIRRSHAWMAMGHMKEATADARMGASVGGGSAQGTADCFAQLGFCLCRSGQLQAALDSYEKGLKLMSMHGACKQGRDECRALMDAQAGRRAIVPGADDVDAQELRTLPAPEGVLGKGFEVVRLQVGTCNKPLVMLLSTTVQQEAVITPAACSMLGMKISRTVDLENVRFEGGKEVGTLTGCDVTSFIQAEIAEKALGTTLHGMLGLPFLARFDLDLDRVRREQRFKEVGAAAKAVTQSQDVKNVSRIGAVHMSSINLPGGLIGLPLQVKVKTGTTFVLGIVDTSSMFSVMSWIAAEELGLAADPEDASWVNVTKVAGATKTGVAEMPLVHGKVSVCKSSEEIGCRLNAISKQEFDITGKGRGWSLGLSEVANMKVCAEFGKVNIAIGDAIQFEMLKDSAVGEFMGAAMLIGQDILAQAPKLTLSAKDRQMWMDPPGRITDDLPL